MHFHRVGGINQQSPSLLYPSPPALNLSQQQSLLQKISSSNQVAKALEFQDSGWIIFRTDWFDLLAVQGTLKTLRLHAAAAAVLLQSCPTLCDPIDGSPPGSPVPGILQARTLEWVAISFSNA